MAISLAGMIKRCFRRSASEKGSVLLEFALCIPLYLFLWGALLFMFEMSGARLLVLESNRNLAWTGADRFGIGVRQISDTVRAIWTANTGSRQFSFRNADRWVAKMQNPGNGSGEDFWAENNWSSLFAGNIHARMDESSLYSGLLMILSLDRTDKSVENAIAETSDLTYDPGEGEQDLNPSDLVVRRRSSKNYEINFGRNWECCDMSSVFSQCSDNWHMLSRTQRETQPETAANETAYQNIRTWKITQ